jgi:hypothetical protein
VSEESLQRRPVSALGRLRRGKAALFSGPAKFRVGCRLAFSVVRWYVTGRAGAHTGNSGLAAEVVETMMRSAMMAWSSQQARPARAVNAATLREHG